jgi:hypothetical protein
MALLNFIGARDNSTATTPSQMQSAQEASGKGPTEAPTTPSTPLSGDPVTAKGAAPPPTSDPPPVSQSHESNAPPVAGQPDPATRTPITNRRWSFQGHFRLLRKSNAPRTTVAPAAASDAPTDRAKPSPSTPLNANRRAKQSALIVRSLIVGQDTDEGGVAPPRQRYSGAQMKHVKAQLLKPKTAGKVIAELRALPAFADSAASRAGEAIQAVCLPYSDEEADKKHLSNLRNVKATATTATTTKRTPSPIGGATIDAITEAIRNLHVVSLFTTPDLGLGEPGDGPGILAGAVPTAETVLTGVTQITPELMALGYATGKAVIPSDKDIYPPTDRMSILTCTSPVGHHVAAMSDVRCCRLVGPGTPPTPTNFSISECEFLCSDFGVTSAY